MRLKILQNRRTAKISSATGNTKLTPFCNGIALRYITSMIVERRQPGVRMYQIMALFKFVYAEPQQP